MANCGRFAVPGSGAVHSYSGVVKGRTLLQVWGVLQAHVSNLRVIEHPHPLLLLGADVLRGGRPRDSWNFQGLRVETTGLNQVDAWLEFSVGGDVVRVPLPHAPAGEVEASGTAIAQVSNGQCLRRQL